MTKKKKMNTCWQDYFLTGRKVTQWTFKTLVCNSHLFSVQSLLTNPSPVSPPHPTASVSLQMSGDSWLKGNIVTPSVSSEQDVCFVFSLSSAGVLSRITSIQIFSCRLLSTFVATRLSGLQWMVIAAGSSTLFKVGNIPPDILGDSESKSTTVLLHEEMHDTHTIHQKTSLW